MAAVSGVSMQSGSPARELSVSLQSGGNQTHGERPKPEEVTGKNTTYLVSFVLVWFETMSDKISWRARWLRANSQTFTNYSIFTEDWCHNS